MKIYLIRENSFSNYLSKNICKRTIKVCKFIFNNI